MKILVMQFAEGNVPLLNSSAVCLEIRQQFVREIQQDAPEFLTTLLLKHAELRITITYTDLFYTKCTECSYVNYENNENSIKLIPVQPFAQSALINDLFKKKKK